jgi:polysaccharide pyruvyl transferase WcaK-like protein
MKRSWENDPNWTAAVEIACKISSFVNVIFTPSEFLNLSEKFAPLEFSWVIKREILAFCASKDSIHRIAPWLINSIPEEGYIWSNEVFVIGVTSPINIKVSDISKTHLISWENKVKLRNAGIATYKSSFKRLNYTAADCNERAQTKNQRILIIGASNMGNVGDDFLAEAISDALNNKNIQVFSSSPDLDPLDLAYFGGVVIGGGGLIYSSLDGGNDAQNFANYFKFGPIAASYGIPACFVGIGDQDHENGINKLPWVHEFALGAAPFFQFATTRDKPSARLMRRLGVPSVQASSDLVFSFNERAIKVNNPINCGNMRIALTGELFSYKGVKNCLEQFESCSTFLKLVGEDIDYLVMSDDDFEHANRCKSLLKYFGITLVIHDLRGYRFESVIYVFSSYSFVITTRFHGMVLSWMSETPVLAIDRLNGKKHRLVLENNLEEDIYISHKDSNSEEFIEKLKSRLNINQDIENRKEINTKLEGLSQMHYEKLNYFSKSIKFLSSSVHTKIPFTEDSFISITPSGPSVRLCWAASSANTENFGNLGDSLSAVMVAGLSGLPIEHVNFDADIGKLVGVGSIAHSIQKGKAVLWGPGVSIRSGILAENVRKTKYDVRATRGHISASHLRDFGIDVPKIYGDPVWFLPSIFYEEVEKKYELGVIPHIQDIQGFGPNAPPKSDSLRYFIEPKFEDKVTLINTWHEPTWDGIVAKLRQILSCKRILSQSFHGVVIAEAYGIPVLNYRHIPGKKTGLLRIDLNADCGTDPRIFEFYHSGIRDHFYMYSQRRTEYSEWDKIIENIDAYWNPFFYDPEPLLRSFPMPLAFNPMKEKIKNIGNIKKINF